LTARSSPGGAAARSWLPPAGPSRATQAPLLPPKPAITILRIKFFSSDVNVISGLVKIKKISPRKLKRLQKYNFFEKYTILDTKKCHRAMENQ
jgi:hypothetical protein